MAQEIYTDYEIKQFAAVEESLEPKDGFLHDWVFHFNPYTELWNAIPRNLYNLYWSNYNLDGVLRSKNIIVLFDLINKSKGDISKIDSIVEGNV